LSQIIVKIKLEKRGQAGAYSRRRLARAAIWLPRSSVTKPGRWSGQGRASAYKSSWKHDVAGLVFPALECVGAGLARAFLRFGLPAWLPSSPAPACRRLPFMANHRRCGWRPQAGSNLL